MINMKTFYALLTFFLAFQTHFAQQLDPIHYPSESEWEFLKTKQTDSLIYVMKFYFNADDTLFFREARSQQVVKVALRDVKPPDFSTGIKYYFAERFYGPNGSKAIRTSKNEKLDRFYYYYLNVPELNFTKVALVNEKEDATTSKVDTPTPSSGLEIKSNPTPEGNTQSYSPLRPQILLKNGCVIYPEHFYFLSEGQLYFGNGVRDNIYKLDTALVQAVVGINVGQNLFLRDKVGYEFGGRCMRFVGIFIGAINVGIVAASISWNIGSGMAFIGSIPTGIVYVKLIMKGTKRIQHKRRYRYAKYAQCQ
jgi:hypothetical protein